MRARTTSVRRVISNPKSESYNSASLTKLTVGSTTASTTYPQDTPAPELVGHVVQCLPETAGSNSTQSHDCQPLSLELTATSSNGDGCQMGLCRVAMGGKRAEQTESVLGPPSPDAASQSSDQKSTTDKAATPSSTLARVTLNCHQGPPESLNHQVWASLCSSATGTQKQLDVSNSSTAAQKTVTTTATQSAVPTTQSDAAATGASDSSSSGGGSSAGIAAGVTIGVLAVAGLIGFFFWRHRRSLKKDSNGEASDRSRKKSARDPYASAKSQGRKYSTGNSQGSSGTGNHNEDEENPGNHYGATNRDTADMSDYHDSARHTRATFEDDDGQSEARGPTGGLGGGNQDMNSDTGGHDDDEASDDGGRSHRSRSSGAPGSPRGRGSFDGDHGDVGSDAESDVGFQSVGLASETEEVDHPSQSSTPSKSNRDSGHSDKTPIVDEEDIDQPVPSPAESKASRHSDHSDDSSDAAVEDADEDAERNDAESPPASPTRPQSNHNDDDNEDLASEAEDILSPMVSPTKFRSNSGPSQAANRDSVSSYQSYRPAPIVESAYGGAPVQSVLFNCYKPPPSKFQHYSVARSPVQEYQSFTSL